MNDTYKGVPIRVRSNKTSWGTWTAEAEIEVSPLEHLVLSIFSPLEDGLLKQYKEEEEAKRDVLGSAKNWIDRSIAKKKRT